MAFTRSFNLVPAPWRPEMDLGEAGITGDFIIVDEEGNKIGKYIEWYNGEAGLFFGDYPGEVTRIILPKEFVKALVRTYTPEPEKELAHRKAKK